MALMDISHLPQRILPNKTMAKLLPMSFLQNLWVDDNGDVIIGSALDGRVWRLGADGKISIIGQVPGQAYSVAPAPDEGFVVFGKAIDGVVNMFHLKESGSVTQVLEIPEALFVNGLEYLGDGRYIFADSYRGNIWEANYWTRTYRDFFHHDLLLPPPGHWEPGPNGLRVFRDKLYISMTSRLLFLSVDLEKGEALPDTMTTVRENIFVDDFDFDRDGNAYMCTHPLDVVYCLKTNGDLTVLAGPEQGVRGNTACRFGKRVGDENSLYIVTDGGLFNPFSGGLKEATVVRLTTEARGGSLWSAKNVRS